MKIADKDLFKNKERITTMIELKELNSEFAELHFI